MFVTAKVSFGARAIALALALALGITATEGHASFGYAKKATDGHAQLVIVRHDKGGSVIDYMREVSRIRKSGTPVRISGRCDSACTLLLSLPREQVCIMRSATFGFHKAYGSTPDMNRWATGLLWKSYPVWVQDWLAKKGGLRSSMTRMRFAQAAPNLRICGSEAAIQAKRTPHS